MGRMIKRFCDRCNTEITDENKAQPMDMGRARANGVPEGHLMGHLAWASGLGTAPGDPHFLDVQCFVIFDGRSNDGDFCKYCIIDAVLAADDRTHDAAGATLKPTTAFRDVEQMLRFLGQRAFCPKCSDKGVAFDQSVVDEHPNAAMGAAMRPCPDCPGVVSVPRRFLEWVGVVVTA